MWYEAAGIVPHSAENKKSQAESDRIGSGAKGTRWSHYFLCFFHDRKEEAVYLTCRRWQQRLVPLLRLTASIATPTETLTSLKVNPWFALSLPQGRELVRQL
jgi:hypothetical protein